MPDKIVNVHNYHEFAARTEEMDLKEIQERMNQPHILRLMHSVAGIATEAGEIADIFKKHVFYGKELDLEHLAEEFGDILWYLAILCDLCGYDFERIMEKNIDKLRVRYPEQFSESDALSRKDKQGQE